MRLAFSLFDDDDNGFICPRDLYVFEMQYAGICDLLMQDLRSIAAYQKS